MRQKFQSYSSGRKLMFGVGAIIALFIAIGAVSPPPPSPKKLNSQNTSSSQNISTQTSKPTVTTQTITETQAVPFTNTTVDNSSLAKGQTKITTPGVNGIETLSYKVTYANGQQINKQLVSDLITTPAVNQVTSIGTYVAPAPSSSSDTGCTNGTYRNTAGNTICSPETAPSAPAGATAKCNDGSYSFSQTHSGTCSHHSGVSEWL